MSMLKTTQPKYTDGRTKQSPKGQTDIATILARHVKAETLDHITRYQGEYGQFANIDLATARRLVERGHEIFMAAPAEIRREFENDPNAFFAFVNDPDNAADLDRLLPGLARPGNQLMANPSPEPPPGYRGRHPPRTGGGTNPNRRTGIRGFIAGGGPAGAVPPLRPPLRAQIARKARYRAVNSQS